MSEGRLTVGRAAHTNSTISHLSTLILSQCALSQRAADKEGPALPKPFSAALAATDAGGLFVQGCHGSRPLIEAAQQGSNCSLTLSLHSVGMLVEGETHYPGWAPLMGAYVPFWNVTHCAGLVLAAVAGLGWYAGGFGPKYGGAQAVLPVAQLVPAKVVYRPSWFPPSPAACVAPSWFCSKRSGERINSVAGEFVKHQVDSFVFPA